MKGNFIFEYLNENEYNKLEKALKKYNRYAYKDLLFKHYPALKEGQKIGELISTNSKENTETYELQLPTDEMFAKVHGNIKLHYTIYNNEKIVMLDTISPESILMEGHKSELATYKGVMISKESPEKDLFKIELLNMLNK